MAIFRDLWAPPALVTIYYLTVAHHVRRELDRWRRRARQIPDPDLRRFALEKLEGEHLNAQAAAVFATLVPLRHRAAGARLMVAFEVMYDYLDAVSEQPALDPLRNGLRLHAALTEVVAPRPRPGLDFYAFGSYAGDGGYLTEVITACRRRLAALPAVTAVRPALLCSVARCAEGQTRTHAADQAGTSQLRTWADSLAGASQHHTWWELAAGAASSLAIHALFAAAGEARTTAADARKIEAAYFPSVCALSTLLDAFVDRRRDAARGVHNYVDYYDGPATVARRLGAIACDANDVTLRLPYGRRRAAIVAGVVAFYLSAMERECASMSASRRIIDSLSPRMVRPLLAVVRLKRCLEGV